MKQARTEVHQRFTIELDNELTQDSLASLRCEDRRTAIAEAIADEFADRLGGRSEPESAPSHTSRTFHRLEFVALRGE